MSIEKQVLNEMTIRFSHIEEEKEIGRAFLYILKNDLHKQPFGLMEDVFIDKSKRGRHLGREIIKQVLEEAKARGCYKIICTCRYEKPKVHEIYSSLNFKDHGKEFRIDYI